jgi:hypothetical protein
MFNLCAMTVRDECRRRASPGLVLVAAGRRESRRGGEKALNGPCDRVHALLPPTLGPLIL